MKTKTKILSLAGIAAFGFVLQSFNGEEGEKYKRYEIIHTENGVSTYHDTVIQATSDYTIQNYIADLGYAGKGKVEVIKMGDLMNETETFVMEMQHDKIVEWTEEMELEPGEHKEIKRVIVAESETVKDENGNEPVIEMHKVELNLDDDFSAEELRKSLKEQGLDDAMIDQILFDIEGAKDADGVVHEEHRVEMKIVMTDDDEAPIDEKELEEHVVFESKEGNRVIKVAVDGVETSTIAIESMTSSPKTANTLNSEKEALDIHFYPNPSTSSFTLEFESKGKGAVKVLNLDGKVVYEKELQTAKGKVKEEITTSDWAPGIYLIEVLSGDNNTSKKLIIQ